METPLMGKAYRAKTTLQNKVLRSLVHKVDKEIGQVCARTSPRGQGSMEYLLLLGGAALIVLVVVVLIFNLEAGQEEQGAASLNVFDQVANKLTGCGNGEKSTSEQCDEGTNNDGSGDLSSPVACNTLGFTSSTASVTKCKVNCSYDTSVCG
ncbi:MAG TPA: class III signal peptide-containing protein [archaeon]|nr:class III signal peptide-containing protein [archaeon]